MDKSLKTQSQAGKGDRPRNCFSTQFKENYDKINWSKKNKRLELSKKNLRPRS
jgi:hypothetical protein